MYRNCEHKSDQMELEMRLPCSWKTEKTESVPRFWSIVRSWSACSIYKVDCQIGCNQINLPSNCEWFAGSCLLCNRFRWIRSHNWIARINVIARCKWLLMLMLIGSVINCIATCNECIRACDGSPIPNGQGFSTKYFSCAIHTYKLTTFFFFFLLSNLHKIIEKKMASTAIHGCLSCDQTTCRHVSMPSIRIHVNENRNFRQKIECFFCGFAGARIFCWNRGDKALLFSVCATFLWWIFLIKI